MYQIIGCMIIIMFLVYVITFLPELAEAGIEKFFVMLLLIIALLNYKTVIKWILIVLGTLKNNTM